MFETERSTTSKENRTFWFDFSLPAALPSEVQPCADCARDRLHARADKNLCKCPCFTCALAVRQLPSAPPRKQAECYARLVFLLFSWRSRVKCSPVRTAPATFRFSIYAKLHRSKTCFSVSFSLRAFSTYTKLHRSKTLCSVKALCREFSTYTKLHRSKTILLLIATVIVFSTYTKLHRSKTPLISQWGVMSFSTYTKLHRSKTTTAA